MKLNLKEKVLLWGIIVLFSSFGSKKKFSKEIIVENSLTINRIDEVVAINLKKLKAKKDDYSNLLVKDQKGVLQPTQIIDNNLVGNPDELLFLANVPALSKASYTVFDGKNEIFQGPKSKYTTYARFVPERTDDFAWENDRVAFRTYGPEAQRLVEERKPNGTLSSGIDLWLKKVTYPIIDD